MFHCWWLLLTHLAELHNSALDGSSSLSAGVISDSSHHYRLHHWWWSWLAHHYSYIWNIKIHDHKMLNHIWIWITFNATMIMTWTSGKISVLACKKLLKCQCVVLRRHIWWKCIILHDVNNQDWMIMVILWWMMEERLTREDIFSINISSYCHRLWWKLRWSLVKEELWMRQIWGRALHLASKNKSRLVWEGGIIQHESRRQQWLIWIMILSAFIFSCFSWGWMALKDSHLSLSWLID